LDRAASDWSLQLRQSRQADKPDQPVTACFLLTVSGQENEKPDSWFYESGPFSEKATKSKPWAHISEAASRQPQQDVGALWMRAMLP
jgi:hypothetical protein